MVFFFEIFFVKMDRFVRGTSVKIFFTFSTKIVKFTKKVLINEIFLFFWKFFNFFKILILTGLGGRFSTENETFRNFGFEGVKPTFSDPIFSSHHAQNFFYRMLKIFFKVDRMASEGASLSRSRELFFRPSDRLKKFFYVFENFKNRFFWHEKFFLTSIRRVFENEKFFLKNDRGGSKRGVWGSKIAS